MSKTLFTPGPWHLEGPDYSSDYTITGNDDALAICAVVNGEMRRMGGKDDEHAANANLIAAAPDLYEALMSVMYSVVSDIELPRHGLEKNVATFEHAIAVLAKARGEKS